MPDILSRVENLADEDTLNKGKTIYDVSYKQLLWRNFLAGMSRAVGMVFIQFLFFAVIAGFVAQFVLPQVMGLFGGYMNTLNTLQGGAKQTQFSFDSIKELLPTQ
ncbi:hypothetical protein KBC89_02785 [Candidatus Woesebacteria bacterium]|nr:hypothetical protein [Candidatus Woesebacteria bacterium]